MKRNLIKPFLSSILSISLLLSGCANAVPPDPAIDNPAQSTEEHTLPDKQTASDTSKRTEQDAADALPLSSASTTVEQGGPYGKLSLSIPAGWRYETHPMDSQLPTNGLYGIRFYPENAAEGCIDLAYFDSFGVCGTGLAQETTTIAGNAASIGTYDNHAHWDFITFHDDYSGIVALICEVDSWWDACDAQVMDILNTLSYDTSIKEGGAFIRSSESEADKIGLYVTLKAITPSGATLVFEQYDEKAPTGNLEYGSDFVLEILKENTWEEVPVIPDNYGFHEVAWSIAKKDTTEQEIDWTWIYGTLAPGVYRIQKQIMDFRDTGDYDKYTVYAQFLLN